MMDYVHRVSQGQRLYFDFFDYYGPFTWLPYAFVYRLAGETVIGVRAFLVALKLISVLLAYGLIRRLGRPLFAALGALVLTALLGQPWSYLQVPYASHLTFPLLLALLWLLLPAGERGATWRMAFAGLVTASMLWTKVNTGAYALVGTLIYLACWAPVPSPAAERTRRDTIFDFVRLAFLLFIGAGFQAFVHEHLDPMFFSYLLLPLVLVLLASAWRIREERRSGRSGLARVRLVAVYASAALVLWIAVLFAYFGRAGFDYLAEQARVLGRLQNYIPVPPLGVRAQYVFNEYFWSQLPWLVSALGLSWVALRKRAHTAGNRELEIADARIACLVAVQTLHGFVLYASGDESHLIQIVLPAAVVLFALIAIFERSGALNILRKAPDRAIFAAVTLLAVSSIVSVPSPICYSVADDWWSPRLRYLRYHAAIDDRFAEPPVGVPYHDWDQQVDEAAQHIAALTQGEDEVLVFGGCQLLIYASHSKAGGGKYSHLLYLLRNRLIDRRSFLDLLPDPGVDELLLNPPRLVVFEAGHDAVLEQLPELLRAFERLHYTALTPSGRFKILVRGDAKDISASAAHVLPEAGSDRSVGAP